ncbi:MAG: hypothetical protein LBV67_11845 [Streptococcaceae bacterium]|jgi:putative endopeptidase|nr:hypothetical protein [Streptococcaceae bacterium]
MSNVRVQDDLYEAINGSWIEKATIPADKPAIGSFLQLVEGNEKLLMDEFVPMRKGKVSVPSELKNFIKIYRQAVDFETRNELGIKPVQPILARILAIENFEEFKSGLVDWEKSGMSVPWGISISEDLKNTDKRTFWFSSPGLILPDTSYYSDEKKEERKALLAVFRSMNEKLLKIAGLTLGEATKLIDLALAFDEKIVPFANTSEENNQVEHYYTPVNFKELVEKWSTIPLRELLDAMTGVKIKDDERVAISEKRWSDNFATVINEANFEEMKAWMYLDQLSRYTTILSEELRIIGGEYSRALSGVKEARPQEKHAFDLATGIYSQVIGLYYGKKYFGEKAKQDVKHMVEKMIDVYKIRLKENEWLSEETINKAIFKLENLGVFIGYPDKLEDIYLKFIVDEKKSLAENILYFRQLKQEKAWSDYHLPTDRQKWHMPAHMVNAYFNPSANHIVFPAAILQAPFYSLDQTPSQNYGGIGAVIAHEISHAFDNNGSKFDERGNLNNWWTDEDYAKFEEKKQLMIKQFDGLKTSAGVANGTLTVSENIADLGGVNAALTAAKLENGNIEEFFTNWVTIWRSKARLEYQTLLLSVDPHAPTKLRGNIIPRNFEDFYTTFDVKKGDGMYMEVADRIEIW